MQYRLATYTDLPVLNKILSNVVEHMHQNNIRIWNEFYPAEELENDIANHHLYVIVLEEQIVSVFGIYDNISSQNNFKWKDAKGKALYFGRFFVNTNFLKNGIGTRTLAIAQDISKRKKAAYLRLLVSDENTPAINLYVKNNFKKVEGIYVEFSEGLNKNITEFGFEKEL